MNRDYNLMRMERSGDDCNCETLTRDDVSDIGVRSNELGSRNQGIIDSHDSSPTLRLSEEIKRIKQNQQIISFHKRNSSIDSTSQEVTIKQATNTLNREIPFCFQGVVFIQQQAVPALPQCQSI